MISNSSKSTTNHKNLVDTNTKIRVRAPEFSHTEFLIQNHSNFKRTGPPARFMYYEAGSWLDFAADVVYSLREGFQKAVIEIEIGGNRYLFDLYRMLQIDLESGSQRSVSWIDIHGNCFFPKTFIDSDLEVENSKIEIEIRVCGGDELESGKRKREEVECVEGSSSTNEKKRPRIDACVVESPRWPKVKMLGEREKAYLTVKNLFLSGIEPGAKVTGIYQCIRNGPLDRARYEVFQKQMEIIKAARGDANMTFGWHGTTAKGVTSILSHGFAMASTFSESEAHGIGIYLSPVRSPHLSAMLSEEDDSGEKHVILCRVILGKCEKIEAGSRQMYPSGVDFDTGVDDLKNPKWYVVWCANMNTHIIPECVVSYKPSGCAAGVPRGSAFLKTVPESTHALFTTLCSKLGSSLPSSRVQDLQTLCLRYKDGKLAKDTFMKHLRSIVGDGMVGSTIPGIHG